jgi:hypothetical protein
MLKKIQLQTAEKLDKVIVDILKEIHDNIKTNIVSINNDITFRRLRNLHLQSFRQTYIFYFFMGNIVRII